VASGAWYFLRARRVCCGERCAIAEGEPFSRPALPIDVVGGDTGRRYRIYRAHSLNIAELDEEGRCVMVWCFMPEGDLVRGDNMLAQKLALELFETEALARSNRFPPSKLNRF
jgi:hypothetical protein